MHHTEQKPYQHEISMIVREKEERPSDYAGDFKISPRGHTPTRVSWHEQGNTIYIDDIFHHKDNYSQWIKQAKEHKITPDNYEYKRY
jgi:hypothetical protein